MELRQLAVVKTVAEAGSFTAAAKQLHVSQSAVSRTVSMLEDELGEPLFLRLGRAVRLTSAGETLVQLSRRVLADVRETADTLTEHRRTLKGSLHLAGGMTVCLHVFPALLEEYRKKYPGVDIKLTTGSTPELVEKIRTGLLDVTLLTLPVGGSDLVETPVMREELLLVMHPQHPLASRRRVSPSDLHDRPCVLFEHGSSTRRVIDQMFAREAVQPRIVMETENVEILKALVSIGMGMTIIPYQAVAREVRARQLRCARLDGVRLVRETGWVYVRVARVPRLVQHMFAALERTLPRFKLSPRSLR